MKKGRMDPVIVVARTSSLGLLSRLPLAADPPGEGTRASAVMVPQMPPAFKMDGHLGEKWAAEAKLSENSPKNQEKIGEETKNFFSQRSRFFQSVL